MAKDIWTDKNIRDLSGQTAIITGANTGLGKETAKVLAGKNAAVILAVRNLEKGEEAAQEIRNQFSYAITKVMELDLSSLKSINSFADNK